jgi:Tfp pilus assembly protein PilF
MGLNDSHNNALLKKQQKENDNARAALKKELKRRHSQTLLFSRDAAKHFEHERRDVAAHFLCRGQFLIDFVYFFCFLY